MFSLLILINRHNREDYIYTVIDICRLLLCFRQNILQCCFIFACVIEEILFVIFCRSFNLRVMEMLYTGSLYVTGQNVYFYILLPYIYINFCKVHCNTLFRLALKSKQFSFKFIYYCRKEILVYFDVYVAKFFHYTPFFNS